MKVRFKKLVPEAVIPTKAHASDAGADLTATSIDVDYNKCIITYGTGIAVEIPEGYVGLVFPRSSVYKTGMTLTNCVGVIDSHYRGEIMAKFRLGKKELLGMYVEPDMTKCYDIGDRIAQLIIMPYPEIEYEEADELSETDRGEGGYGSTGR